MVVPEGKGGEGRLSALPLWPSSALGRCGAALLVAKYPSAAAPKLGTPCDCSAQRQVLILVLPVRIRAGSMSSLMLVCDFIMYPVCLSTWFHKIINLDYEY